MKKTCAFCLGKVPGQALLDTFVPEEVEMSNPGDCRDRLEDMKRRTEEAESALSEAMSKDETEDVRRSIDDIRNTIDQIDLEERDLKRAMKTHICPKCGRREED